MRSFLFVSIAFVSINVAFVCAVHGLVSAMSREVDRHAVGTIVAAQSLPVGRHADSLTVIETTEGRFTIWGEMSYRFGASAWVIDTASAGHFLWIEGQPNGHRILGY